METLPGSLAQPTHTHAAPPWGAGLTLSTNSFKVAACKSNGASLRMLETCDSEPACFELEFQSKLLFFKVNLNQWLARNYLVL